MFAEIIFGGRCLLCGVFDAFSVKYALCKSCFGAEAWKPETERRCVKCSRLLISEDEICMRCRGERYPFVKNCSLWEYSGNIKKLISFYKFRNCLRLSAFFAANIVSCIKESYGSDRNILLIPAPCSGRRSSSYGCGHLEKICRIIEKRSRIKVLFCMGRKKGRELKTLNREERKKELCGKISIMKGKRKILEKYRDRRIILFDDIFTTGSTASACARVLLDEGAENIEVMTLALD